MVTVAITSVGLRNAHPYTQVLEALGAQGHLLTPKHYRPTQSLMDGMGGLLLTGGPDIDPSLYGTVPDPKAGLEVDRPLDDLELEVLSYALERDMPVLAICRGMQLLNVARGGRLIQDLPGHQPEPENRDQSPKLHSIFLSPGSKAAAVIGMAGFFRVNSDHHQGLRDADKSPRLMATAYAVDDGLIEGLESPEHTWVIGLQCHPERQEQVPRIFGNLFAAFRDRAAAYLGVVGPGQGPARSN